MVPAPNLPLLALAVLVPELAPWFAATCVVVAGIAFALARGRTRIAALALAFAALACTLVPIVEYPAARAAANAELASQLGDAGTRPVTDGGGLRVLRDRPVLTRDGDRLALDVYVSARPGARPTIVTIYGGAWIFGTRSQMAGVDERYARLGYTVVAIDYRHAPAFRFPTQVNDVEDALGAIARNAIAWHVDTRRVALFGRSAGAELALLAAYAPGPLRIRTVVGYYTPTDLVRGYDDPPAPDPSNVRHILTTYIGGTPSDKPAAYRAASPLALVKPGLPPTFLVQGRRDALVRIAFQRELRDALRAHGDRVVAIELPWSNHVFDEVTSGLGSSIATPATERFLAATL